MEYISFSRSFLAVSLILIYVIQKLVGLAHQATPMNLKPLHEDMDLRHLAFEDQLQFIDSDDYKTDKLLSDIQLDSVSVSYLSVSVLMFELNERQGCLGAANYSVMRTFSAVNVGKMVLKIRGFKIGSPPPTTNGLLRTGRVYDIAKPETQQKPQGKPHNQHQQQNVLHQQQPQSVCHGYGFTIYDCEPFDLEPNREHKIRIAFNPDFTLTKTVVSLSILTNLDEEFKFALVASIPRNLVATCNRSIPRPDWEPTMQLLLAIGILTLQIVSMLYGYLKAMRYLRSHQTPSAQLNNARAVPLSNHHNAGSCKDGYDRNNCPSNLSDSCNRDRSYSNGHGAAAISSSISSHQASTSLSSALPSSNGKIYNNNSATVNKGNNNKASICTQKRRKNSSNANSEKVPTSNKSLGSAANDKKSSSPYAPIFQNLTNVIASPPPPLPSFDNEYNSLEFKKLRSRKSAKKSNSLNGSIASGDDIGLTTSLNQTINAGNKNSVVGKGGSSFNSATSSSATSSSRTTNGSSGSDPSNLNKALIDSSEETFNKQASSVTNEGVSSKTNAMVSKNGLKGAPQEWNSERKTIRNDSKASAGSFEKDIKETKASFDCTRTGNEAKNLKTKSTSPEVSRDGDATNSLKFLMDGQLVLKFNGCQDKKENIDESSKSSPASTATTSSSSSSSTSSSPPLSASSYGEYSLLGPGATFELPCLRVRSAQI